MDGVIRNRSGGPREVEIKLEVDPRRLDDLRRSLQLHAFPERTVRLLSTYFDADGLPLRKAGFSWRIRRVGDHLIQTVKAQGSAAVGLHDRPEWEREIKSEQPDIDVMGRTNLVRRLELDSLRGRLKPQFSTDINRTIWHIRWEDSVVEAACDQGTVTAGDRSANIVELELELVDGSLADLYSLARDLASSCAAQLAVTSKADRGYALVTGESGEATKAEPIPLTPNMSAADAFKLIVRGCICQFRLNESLIRDSRDVEALHQARVALRRLSSALSIFGRLANKKRLAHVSDGLERLFRKLGRARNLDVYLDAIRQGAAENPVSLGLIPEVVGERDRAYDDVIAELASPEWRDLLLDLSAFVEVEAWLDHRPSRGAAQRPVRDFASRSLERQWQRIRDIGSPIDRLASRARHRLRLRTKTFRYSCEFFEGAFAKRKAAKRYRRFIARLGDLQDVLGILNDLATNKKLAKSAATRSVRRDTQQAKAELLTRAVAAHLALKKAKPFW